MECYLCSNTPAIINSVDISSLYNHYITNSVFTNRVIIDNKLRWNDHIAYVKNKISKSLGIL